MSVSGLVAILERGELADESQTEMYEEERCIISESHGGRAGELTRGGCRESSRRPKGSQRHSA